MNKLQESPSSGSCLRSVRMAELVIYKIVLIAHGGRIDLSVPKVSNESNGRRTIVQYRSKLETYDVLQSYVWVITVIIDEPFDFYLSWAESKRKLNLHKKWILDGLERRVFNVI